MSIFENIDPLGRRCKAHGRPLLKHEGGLACSQCISCASAAEALVAGWRHDFPGSSEGLTEGAVADLIAKISAAVSAAQVSGANGSTA